MKLDCNGRVLDLAEPAVMGVLNTTPDSFSDGGRYQAVDDALAHAADMVREGARIIDVGGESTRPGAQPVSLDAELDRVIPVIERIVSELDVVVSVDTMKAEVMREAAAAGAGLINDVNALHASAALEAAVETGVPVCIMHMQGEPQTMQDNPRYEDVLSEVGEFLLQRAGTIERAGVRREHIVIDPGFGFGKTLAHNLSLLAGLGRLAGTGYPLLVGMSRKSMLRALLDVAPHERVYGGVAAAALAVERGASIVRTHDVRPTVHAVKVAAAVRDTG